MKLHFWMSIPIRFFKCLEFIPILNIPVTHQRKDAKYSKLEIDEIDWLIQK